MNEWEYPAEEPAGKSASWTSLPDVDSQVCLLLPPKLSFLLSVDFGKSDKGRKSFSTAPTESSLPPYQQDRL